MKKILIVLAALAVLAPAAALAAGPAGVTVRVEGTSDTLLARTAVQTTTTPVVKDGNPSDSCTGTSVAGALEVATAGNWSGSWFGSGYSVETILGESHAFGSGHYYGEFVNGVPGNGACADELAPGDEVLFAPEPESGAMDNPMYLQAPATAQRGAAFNVTVTEKVTTYDSSFNPTTVTQPVQGASVGGATTDANGIAAVTLTTTGSAGLRATHVGDIRTATETVCVHDGDDGTCGTTKPGDTPPPPPAPCIHDGDDGTCGTPDHKATYGFIKSIREHQHFRHGHGPRELRGTSDPDPSGLKDVQLRLTVRAHGDHCATFSSARLRFVHMKRCGARRGKWFSIGSKADWTYLLPKALGRGRYVLDLKTIDGAGNADSKLARTRNRVVFFVA